MTDTQNQSDLPTAPDMLESVLVLITGAVLAAPMLPGFTLCVAGLIAMAVVRPANVNASTPAGSLDPGSYGGASVKRQG
jgi:hypothetical protein